MPGFTIGEIKRSGSAELDARVRLLRRTDRQTGVWEGPNEFRAAWFADCTEIRQRLSIDSDERRGSSWQLNMRVLKGHTLTK